MNDSDKESEKEEQGMDDSSTKVLVYAIVGMLGLGFVAILFVIVPWMLHEDAPSWKQFLIDDSIVLITIVMFVYGFYMNTKIH
ncbi:hypothetical protein [Nitrospina watsonii]|uniref:Uncharacterized protein n=1 Tax=Nitrospina watsonii TaxID=1323948 RepID=A0ABM9HAS6_9BACT|nr:hypothetical protein [Nitrospina watsonii]CAI2717259.1 conserved protein of unknown function [Nitrospina watsonii]